MTTEVPDILARIVEYKKAELASSIVRREESKRSPRRTGRCAAISAPRSWRVAPR